VRVCFLTAEYPPDVYWGGIATYTHAMAKALAARGVHVHVIAKSGSCEREETRDGVHVHWLRDRRPRVLTPLRWARVATEWMLYFSARAARKLREIERRFGPIYVVETPESQAPGFWAACVDHWPVVTHLANPGYSTRQYTQVNGHRLDHGLRDVMERQLTRRCVAITSPSRIMADKVARDWRIRPGRIRVIPNPTPPLPTREDPEVSEGLLHGKRYWLFFGRLQTLKGVHLIAQALPAALAEAVNLHIVFVARDLPYGNSTMKQYVLEQCRGYEGRLFFVEKLDKPQLVPVIRRAECCVLPSLWENFPNVVLESLSLGRPTIASRGTGAAEIIEDGRSGILVDNGSVRSLREAMLRVVRMSALKRDRMSCEAVARSDTFDVMRIAQQRMDCYRGVCGSR